ncbi:MAG TPA: hypothetical protein VH437_23410 [Terriglobales bacterium]|jgi:hypothetical protein
MNVEPQTDISLSTKESLLSSALDHRLFLYTVAAGACLAATPVSNAEVLFTPSNAVVQRSGPKTLAIDIDHDGLADFTLGITHCLSFSFSFMIPCLRAYTAAHSNQIAASSKWAAVLNKGAAITGHHSFIGNVKMTTYFGFLGFWGNTANKFLGVRFLIAGEVHYGWIGFRSVKAEYPAISATLAGWAYETVPNTPIIAGDMGTAAPLDSSISPTSLEILATGHTAIEQRRKRNTP